MSEYETFAMKINKYEKCDYVLKPATTAAAANVCWFQLNQALILLAGFFFLLFSNWKTKSISIQCINVRVGTASQGPIKMKLKFIQQRKCEPRTLHIRRDRTRMTCTHEFIHISLKWLRFAVEITHICPTFVRMKHLVFRLPFESLRSWFFCHLRYCWLSNHTSHKNTHQMTFTHQSDRERTRARDIE